MAFLLLTKKTPFEIFYLFLFVDIQILLINRNGMKIYAFLSLILTRFFFLYFILNSNHSLLKLNTLLNCCRNKNSIKCKFFTSCVGKTLLIKMEQH